MSFQEIKGQSRAVKLLQQAISLERIAHTYLFYGPAGVGKQLTALNFAQALNCLDKKADACGQCSACRQIAEFRHPDVTWVFPVARSRRIKIDQVRRMQQALSLKAYSGRMKAAIIVDAHTLTPPAGNALLKTLEEPPANSVLILVTQQPEALLPTIRSRAQEIQFFHLLPEDMICLLEQKIGLAPKEARLFSRLGLGSMERALKLRDEKMAGRRQLLLQLLAKGSFAEAGEMLGRVDEIIAGLNEFKEDLTKKLREEGREGVTKQEEEAFIAGEYKNEVEQVLGLVTSWYRDILIYHHSKKPELLLNADFQDKIEYWAGKLDTEELCLRLATVDKIRTGLSRNISLKLLLQVMFAEL